MPMSQTDDRPTTWFRERFPTETVSGVEMVYNAESSRTEYYSVSWLAETFETTITTAENPRQRLAGTHSCGTCSRPTVPDTGGCNKLT